MYVQRRINTAILLIYISNHCCFPKQACALLRFVRRCELLQDTEHNCVILMLCEMHAGCDVVQTTDNFDGRLDHDVCVSLVLLSSLLNSSSTMHNSPLLFSVCIVDAVDVVVGVDAVALQPDDGPCLACFGTGDAGRQRLFASLGSPG